jgi:hypothetical protein
MPRELVTVASFANGFEANLAKGLLESNGVQAFLDNENTLNWSWPLAVAVGGVKLQVADDDAYLAKEILDSVRRNGASTVESDETCDGSQSHDSALIQDGMDESLLDEDLPLTKREQDADRAFRGAFLGVFFFPIQFYVLWLVIKIIDSEDRLSPAKRTRVIVAAALGLPCLLVWTFFMVNSFAPSLRPPKRQEQRAGIHRVEERNVMACQ